MILAAVLAALCSCSEPRPSNAPQTSAPSAPAPPPRPAHVEDAAASQAPLPAPSQGEAPRADPCRATPWAMYGHDPARTSASDGCVEGALAVTWKLTRKGTCGYRFRPGRIVEVVGDEKALFAAVDCGQSPAVMRISPKGEPGWTFSRADFGRWSWPALAGENVLSVDDGVFSIDRETGKYHGRELDVWGEPIVVGDAFFTDNTFQLDGAGPFVGSFDASLKWRWKASAISVGKGTKVGRTGGIAYADGLVVHSAARGARSIPSLAAHAADTGERKWSAPSTWPETSPSIANGRVFTVERWWKEKTDRLVARALADGAVVWSTPTFWARGPAPVIADKLVLLHGADGVRAYDRDTGSVVWTAAVPRKAPYQEDATTMAVATGSQTVVVTSGPRLVVLALEDGKEKWSDAVVSGSSPTSIGGLTVERPVIIGRAVYVTSDGTLLRLDPK